MSRHDILFLNRSYWPDAEATGQLLTELCEDLSETFDVSVLTGQPNRNLQNQTYRRWGRESHNGVQVRRIWHSRFPKSWFVGRVVNYLSFMAIAALTVFFGRRPSVVVAQTDPPLLCLLGELLRLRGCRLVVYLQDIYPDVAVALGKLPDNWWIARLRGVFFGIYRRADRVVVLSEDMRSLLVDSGVPAENIVIVPNWVDTDSLRPAKSDNPFRQRLALQERFVVMYSGNMGYSQRLGDALDAAEQLRERKDICWLLVGDGACKPQLVQDAQRRGLSNVQFLDYQPKFELSQSLSAANLHLVLLDPRITQFLMPSKLYGILSAGVPLIALAPADCELSRVTDAEAVGFVVEPGDPSRLAEQVRQAADDRENLAAMGRRARALAVDRYDRARCTGQFNDLLLDVLAQRDGLEQPGAPPAEAAA